ncbi:unnamed protein product [Meganyctiphanes norvegica]|uniref:Uncharacterized protein n=1 Tax=Meganyctiphanes norvegica TaxID=48144 RepID=A0AAV2PN85_MEGNR
MSLVEIGEVRLSPAPSLVMLAFLYGAILEVLLFIQFVTLFIFSQFALLVCILKVLSQVSARIVVCSFLSGISVTSWPLKCLIFFQNVLWSPWQSDAALMIFFSNRCLCLLLGFQI